MPSGNITYDTRALGTLSEPTWRNFQVSGSMLVEGTNTFAAEVHQVNEASLDVVFGLSAIVHFVTPSFLAITNQPADITIEELKPATFTVGYTGAPAYFQRFKWTTNGPEPISGATRATLTITNPLPGVDDTAYFVVLSNVLGQVVSSNARLTLLRDTNAPVLLEADGAEDATRVVLTFNEPLLLDPNDPATCLTNPANYTVTNTLGKTLGIVSAELAEGTNVILTTATGRLPDRNYIATVQSARDVAPIPNLATNLAVPVSRRLSLIGFVAPYYFAQPLPGIDPLDDFISGVWVAPDYDPMASGAGWGFPGWSVFWLGPVNQPYAPLGTQLSVGANGAYLRAVFDFPGSPAGARVWLRHLVDDGAVIYLNGAELARFNMPAGPILPDTPALGEVDPIGLVGPIEVPVSRLRRSGNVVATELHMGYTGGLDLCFAMELQARVDSLVTGPVVITAPPAAITVREGESAVFSFRAVGEQVFQWLSNGVAIAGATNPVYGLDHAPMSADGARYRVVVTGLTNAVESSEAVLTVLPGGEPPAAPFLFITRDPPDRVRVWRTNGGPFTLESSALPDGAWFPVSDQANPFVAPATNAARFFRLKR